MKKKIKFNYFRNLVVLTLFIILPIQCFVFTSSAFLGNKNEQIYFELIDKNSSGNKEKEILVISFIDNYKDILPKDLKYTLKNFSDVKIWLEETFEKEINDFKENAKTYLIVAKTKSEDKIIGVAFFELLDNLNHKTVHVRQFGILEEYQRKGIGTKLLFFIKDLIPNLDLITVDARKVNIKACQFYKKHGFILANSPNDKRLDANKYYGFFLKLSN